MTADEERWGGRLSDITEEKSSNFLQTSTKLNTIDSSLESTESAGLK